MIKDDFIDYKYNQIEYLGKGGFGKVILAENKDTKKKVAIKYITFEHMDEYSRNKIVQEGQILFKFIHNNIIKFEEFSYNNSRAILIMEYAEGGDLNKRINEQKEKKKPFKEEVIITWFLELCNVVKYCHEQHTIHRDLKPLNIFLTKDDHIKLGDFGISKILNSTRDIAKTPIGTPYYMSPEALNGEEYSYSSDIWSLGIILNELCLLENPLCKIKNNNQLCYYIQNNDMASIVQNCEKNYSEETCNLIKKILVKNPYERPTIDQIIEECESILFNLKCIKTYFNNSVFKLTFYDDSSEIEFTKKLIRNFGGKIPDGKYIISKNNDVIKFHIIDGKRIFDCTKKIQNMKRPNSLDNNSQKKSNKNEIQKQNDINLFIEGIDELNDNEKIDKEIQDTVNRITHNGFNIIGKEKKREESCQNKYFYCPDNNKGNFKNFQKEKIVKRNSDRNFGNYVQKSWMINNMLKTTPKVINNIYSNKINKENNKVGDSLNNNNYNGNKNENFESNKYFSNNTPVSNSSSGKTKKDSEEEESNNNFELLNSKNNNENNNLYYSS